VGVTTLVAWIADARAMHSVAVVFPQFRIDFGLSLVLVGVSGWGFVTETANGRLVSFGGFMMLIILSSSTLAEFVATSASNQLSMGTLNGAFLTDHFVQLGAIAFLFCGLAGLLLFVPGYTWLQQGFALLPGIVSLGVATSYAYGIPRIPAIPHFVSGILGMQACMLVVCASVLFLHRDGISSIIWRETTGGSMARLLSPICIVGPVLLGLILEHAGLGIGDPKVGLAGLAISSAVFCLVLLWWTCSRLSVAELAQLGAKQDLLDSRAAYARLLEMEVANRTRELKEALTRERALLHSSPDAICGIDADEKIVFLNEAAATLLGVLTTAATGQQVYSVVRQLKPDSSPCSAQESVIGMCLRERRVVRGPQEIFLKPDGTTFSAEVTVTPIRSGNRSMGSVIGAMVTLRDDRDRMEVERVKSELLSVVSHEIRTPMAAIRGALGLLSSGKIQPADPAYAQLMSLASNNTERLIRLVNDLLDLERLESGRERFEMRPVGTGELAASATEPIKVLARIREVRVESDVKDVPVHANPDRVVQVLTNLLGNALKFSPPNGRVLLRCERHDGEVEFSVQDEGRGIPADKLHAVFERFQQADSSDSRLKGGTGLGLSIARAIVEQHGGHIWVESQLGKGSTFRFTLPVDRSAAPPAENERGAGVANSRSVAETIP
jgi:PAS domain S-box-containing protein